MSPIRCRVCGSMYAGLGSDGYGYCRAHADMYFKTTTADTIEFTGVTDDIAWVIKKAPEFITKAIKIVRKAEPYIDDIIDVVEDPALPAIIQRVRIIRNLNKGLSPTGTPLSGNELAEVGLTKYLPVIDTYIWIKQHVWIVPVAIAGVLLIPGLIGYVIGRATKRCSSATAGYGWPPENPERCAALHKKMKYARKMYDSIDDKIAHGDVDDHALAVRTRESRRDKLEALEAEWKQAGC